ncbi:MAG TPA: response regulator transcription factor [Chloroflexota bacterium]|nr:response regulator transcription factor [Chloroflexota bacterium]
MKVLLATSDIESFERTILGLQQESIVVVVATDGDTAMELLKGSEPHIVIVDAILPPSDGYDLCARIRFISQTPVLIVAATSDEEEVTRGFASGADDVLTRPFGSTMLALRLRAVTGRYAMNLAAQHSTEIRFGDLVVNLETHQVRYEDAVVLLTPIEFRLLSMLASNEGMVVSFNRLIEYGWTRKSYSKSNLDALKTHMTHLRRKLQSLGGQPIGIDVVPRSGYLLPRPRKQT